MEALILMMALEPEDPLRVASMYPESNLHEFQESRQAALLIPRHANSTLFLGEAPGHHCGNGDLT